MRREGERLERADAALQDLVPSLADDEGGGVGESVGESVGVGANVALMSVAECGGEPDAQKWSFDQPATGFLSNAATKSCVNVIGCEHGCTNSHCTQIVYDPCPNSTKGNKGACGPGAFANERWTLTLAGQPTCNNLAIRIAFVLSTGRPDTQQRWKVRGSQRSRHRQIWKPLR